MGAAAAAAERQQLFRDARGSGAIVFDPTRLRQAQAGMLEPGSWGASAVPVQGAGGRGAAWFVQGEFGEGVLRHYRRGGLAARLSADRYLWLGESRVRSLAEFRLLAALRAGGLPVPAPLLAGYWREGLWYRAAILVERIVGARPLASWRDDPTAAAWDACGEAIAALHRAGVDHADLNANNLLLDPDGRAWLIDFDRGRRRGPGGGWREANLRRLQRSLAKLSAGGDAWQAGFQRLHAAYARRLGESVAA